MFFKSSSKKLTKQLNIKIKDHYITKVKSTKFLGTIVDDQLNTLISLQTKYQG